jgi:hypothetical protein
MHQRNATQLNAKRGHACTHLSHLDLCVIAMAATVRAANCI